MPARVTHIELQALVVDLLRATGWRHLTIRRSIGKGRKWTTTTNVIGWPDILAWSPRQPGRIIAIEIKMATGLTREQEECLADLAASGIETYVIRAEDIDDLARTLRPTGRPGSAVQVS